jgi:hypothetical protein
MVRLLFGRPLLPAFPTIRFFWVGFRVFEAASGLLAAIGTTTATPGQPSPAVGTVVTVTLFPVRGAVEVPKIPALVPVCGAGAAFTVPVHGAGLFRYAVWHFDGGTWAGELRDTGEGVG